MTPLKLAIIVSSTRETRFAPKPAAWFKAIATSDPAFEVELVDLRDFDLPFFNERASNAWMPSEDPRAVRWQQAIGRFDAYVATVAEYNHSVTAALKNAFDQAYVEWNRKPIGFVGYGGVGGARAVEHARAIAIELQMVPVRTAVHIGGAEFYKVVRGGEPLESIDAVIRPAAEDMLRQIAWWGGVTKRGREAA